MTATKTNRCNFSITRESHDLRQYFESRSGLILVRVDSLVHSTRIAAARTADGVLMNSTQLASLKDLQTDANDRDVMSGVQAHDRQALEKLYVTYYGPLGRFLSRIGAQASAVDDIINDTFMTIWTGAKEFRRESQVAAWIFGIAYRTALQSVELRGARGFLPFAEIFRRRDADFKSENTYINGLEHRLNRLPLEERVTLALAYQMGFSIDEIAEITEVAPATVEIRMFQARTGLSDNHPIFCVGRKLR